MIVRVIFLLGVVNAGNKAGFPPDEHTLNSSSSGYDDTCGYGHWENMCGDQCFNFEHGSHGRCDCGLDMGINLTPNRCCIPSNESCSTIANGPTQCDKGIVLPTNSFCNNTKRSLQCHNSYQDSQYIGDHSHYTCPHTCVSFIQYAPYRVGEMCRGVNWCESDVQECGPHLRCHNKSLRKSLNSSLVTEHYYCFLTPDEGQEDGQYDILGKP